MFQPGGGRRCVPGQVCAAAGGDSESGLGHHGAEGGHHWLRGDHTQPTNYLLPQVWLSPPVPVYTKFYIFNVTNPEEIAQGARPKVPCFT